MVGILAVAIGSFQVYQLRNRIPVGDLILIFVYGMIAGAGLLRALLDYLPRRS